MKHFISIFVIIPVCCLLFSACIMHELPEFLPGERMEDRNFVWVCEEPFSYLYIDDDILMGPLTFKDKSQNFFMSEALSSRTSYFCDIVTLNNTAHEASFGGETQYSENYFVTKINFDYINFFDGELPTLRFEKMTKENFLEQYGEIANLSGFLE